jgi:dimethylargininase
MRIALVRAVSPSITRCELTCMAREPIDLDRARAQHAQYTAALRSLGVQVVALPTEPELPDAVFVEDAAVVLDDCAVLTRPGAASRRPEVESVAAALKPYRELLRIEAPATVDGGDVMTVGRTLHVGLTSRSGAAAIEQMNALLAPRGYAVRGVPVDGCLHLKSAVTSIGATTLLINPEWVSKEAFPGLDFVEVDPSEPHAANALRVGDTVLFPAAFPRTADRLRDAGFRLMTVDADELAKAEGALTCCSLLFEA